MTTPKSPQRSRKNKKIHITSNNTIPLKSVGYNFREENVETWPASKSSTPTITTNKSVAFLKWQKHPQKIIQNLLTNINKSNKPLLLIQMEDFIQYEMNRPINKCFSKESINEARLEVFRECFDIFISEFSTYQPVLTQIKNEYEDVIAQCFKKVHQVRIIETKLNTLQQDSKSAINKLNESHKTELKQRDVKIEQLCGYINQMKAKHENIDNLLAESEKEEKRLKNELRDAERSSQTFYNEIKKMEIRNEEILRLKQESDNELREVKISHDKILISYESVVNDLKRLQDEIDKGPSISNKEIEEKDKKIKNYQEKLNEYKDLYQSLMNDHQNVLDLYEKVTKERQKEVESKEYELEREVTPRPNWQKVIELNFMSAESIDGKSTDDIMAFMATTLSQLEQKIEMFQSIITDEQLEELQIKDDGLYMDVDYDNNTPKYLRYKGTIRKRRMPKRDLEKLLSDIWSKKYSTKSGCKQSLCDYLYDYFKCEYGIQSRVVETGYSMLSALERYRYDADCELFTFILNGELSEDVYRDQTIFLKNLHNAFQLQDKKKNQNKLIQSLSKLLIEQTIRKLCPAKNEQNMKKLLNALDLNDPHDNVRYELLFKEDRDGNQGPFLEEVRDQHLGEIQDFLQEIKGNLQSVMNQYQQVTVQQIEEIFKRIDSSKPQNEINKYLCVGFGVSMVKSLAKDLLISTDTFYKKISSILIKRSGLETESPSTRRNSTNINANHVVNVFKNNLKKRASIVK